MNNKKLSSNNDVKVCYFDAGGTYGRAGIRARQFVGKGPKMRVAQWKTPEFMDDFQIVKDTKNFGTNPNIALLISWRINILNDNVESSLESVEAYALNTQNLNVKDTKYWRIEIFDGEVFVANATPNPKGEIRDVFSTESKGILLPNNIGEALGGVNGGKFLISLVDENDNIIAKREIFAPKGYEFKSNIKAAFQGLENLLQTPEKCNDKATQLRTE